MPDVYYINEMENYNFRQYLRPFIEREIYFEKIAPYINKDIIKVIIGQRRVGKSYLLYQLMDFVAKKYLDDHIIYINKELADFDFITDSTQLNDFIQSQSKPGRNHIFIDEIQDIRDFERSLRNYIALGNYDIYCTGSNSQLLSGDIAGHLSGRYIEFKIFSLSYTEFLQFHQLENNTQSLNKYMAFGGLPYLVHLELSDNIIYEYLRNVYATVLFKDVVRRYQIRNVYFLEDLVKFLAENIGSLVSAHSISKYLKSQQINMSVQIVLNYMSYLTGSMLLLKTERQDVHGKKVFETNEKYYFEDWGLRNAISGFKVIDTGRLIENIVMLHMLINGFQVRVGVSGDSEIDFVCSRQNKILYLQVAYLLTDEKTINREFGNLLKIKDNYPKYVISMDAFRSSDFKGIIHLSLSEFLTTKW